MDKNFLFDLSNLRANQIDFYNYCLLNVDSLLDLTVGEIAKKYGCGISFIYCYFNALGISGLKEYIYRLGYLKGVERQIDDLFVEQIKKQSIYENSDEFQKIESEILLNYSNSHLNNFNLLVSQNKIIDEFCNTIASSKRLIGFGLGHSAICVDDLFGMFSILGLEIMQLSKEYNKELDFKTIQDDDVLILFSMRGNNKYICKFVKELYEAKPNVKTFLITSNTKSPLIPQVGKTILVTNNNRQADYIQNPLLISYASPFLFFNDFVKNIYLQRHPDNLINNDKLINELES